GTQWTQSYLTNNLTVDADGYPTSTPPAGHADYIDATDSNIDYPTGTHELDWDGDPNARFSLQGAGDPSSVKVAPGRITFNVPRATSDGIRIVLWSQDVGNHIHNMDLYLQDFKPLIQRGDIVTPYLTDAVRIFNGVRLMDFLDTNFYWAYDYKNNA